MKRITLASVLIALALLVGTLDANWGDPLSGRMPRAEAMFPLRVPLDCDATVTTKQHYHERGKTRCYSRKGEPK